MIYDMIIHKWKPEHFYKVRPKSCVLMVNHITFYKSTLSHKIKDEFLRVVNHWKIFTFVSIGPINLQSLIHQHTISVPLKVVLWVFIKTRLQHSFLRREQKTIKWLEWSIKSTSQVTAREEIHCFPYVFMFLERLLCTCLVRSKIFLMIRNQDQKNELTIGLKLIQRIKEVSFKCTWCRLRFWTVFNVNSY